MSRSIAKRYRGTVFTERQRKALDQAIADGMPSLHDIAEKMGIEIESSDSEEDEPHWSLEEPLDDEPVMTAVARKTWRFGWATLALVDHCGEWLAATLGITTPKYAYAIEEIAQIQDEMAEEEA